MTNRLLLICSYAFASLTSGAGPADAMCCGATNFNLAQYHFAVFWIPVLNIPFFFCLAFMLGLQVQKRAWQVGYTRKILALTLNFAPVVLTLLWLRLNSAPSDLDLPARQSSRALELISFSPMAVLSVSLGMSTFLLCALCLVEPVRRRSGFLTTVFAAIDRPEDRPFTIRWLITSLIATWLAVVAWVTLLPGMVQYLMVALFIASVGDALAEPVGVRFGRHKYVVRALGTDRLYTRSIEGSVCVFVSAIVAVAIFIWQTGAYDSFTQLAIAVALIPVAATYAEARAPHTWDQPFIIVACALAAISISIIELMLAKVIVFAAIPFLNVLSALTGAVYYA